MFTALILNLYICVTPLPYVCVCGEHTELFLAAWTLFRTFSPHQHAAWHKREKQTALNGEILVFPSTAYLLHEPAAGSEWLYQCEWSVSGWSAAQPCSEPALNRLWGPKCSISTGVFLIRVPSAESNAATAESGGVLEAHVWRKNRCRKCKNNEKAEFSHIRGVPVPLHHLLHWPAELWFYCTANCYI